MRKVCCPKRDEVTGEWKKLQNEELYSVLLAFSLAYHQGVQSYKTIVRPYYRHNFACCFVWV